MRLSLAFSILMGGTSLLAAPLSPEAQVSTMKRGLTIAWKAPWAAKGAKEPQPLHMARIREAGFDTVQLALWPLAALNEAGLLDAQWLTQLDAMVNAGLKAGLTVILLQHDEGPEARVDALWRALATHYRDASSRLVLGLIAAGGSRERNNADLLRQLSVIRAIDGSRNIRVSSEPSQGLADPADLNLPDADRHLIAVAACFEPYAFTHQGAPWNASLKDRVGISWGSPADREALERRMASFQAWSQQHHRPVFLTAFGAYEKAPLESRITYLQAVARSAEAKGIPWACWQFSGSFSLYDLEQESWKTPLLKALVPEHP
jgi:endoglucanase